MSDDAASSAEPPETLDVAFVEDDRVTREGLVLLTNGTWGFRCVGSWGSVEEALQAATPTPPRVVLLDIDLPGVPGSQGVMRLRERFPETTFVMLTVYDGEEQVFESILNGASGYLLKSTPPARLLEGLQEAAHGGAPMTPVIATRVLGLLRAAPAARPAGRSRAPGQPEAIDLTDAQRRLLVLLAEGHGYRGAAQAMGISPNTVRNHVRAVYDKLHVHSKNEAVARALRDGLI
jgi:DNA-binding NarL/FixJ family response regulator